MEIEKGLTEWFNLTEEKGRNQENLLAFWDFCHDFFGREDCGSLPPPAWPGNEAEHE